MMRVDRRMSGLKWFMFIVLIASCVPLVSAPLETVDQPCFIPNRGQVRSTDHNKDSVLYYTKLGGMTVYFRNNGISYLIPTTSVPAGSHRNRFRERERRLSFYRLDVDFVGCNTACMTIPRGQQGSIRNFYHTELAAPVLDVPAFDEIRYENIYTGIDLRFRFDGSQLKYDFIVASGADPRRIALRASNADGVTLGDDSSLIIHHPFGTIHDNAPVADQYVGDQHVAVPVAFDLRGANIIGFQLPSAYDHSQELVIDPAITWSTFFGGSKIDEVGDLVLDHRGNLIVCGSSVSDAFPGSGTYNQGNWDFFVSLFNPDRTLNTTTYYGGVDLDIAFGVAVDKADNVFICGESWSQDLNFAKNVFQWSNSNTGVSADAIVVKFNKSLKYQTGTFIGGGSEDVAYDIAVDPDGNVAMAGKTQSDNFPVQSARYPTRFGNAQDVDAFVCRWTNTLALSWSTYYGGKYNENATCIATDQSDNIYVGGWTQSGNLAALDGFQQKLSGTSDGFLVSFSALGFPLHATLFGGNGDENINAIDLAFGRIVASGYTGSGNDLPNFGVKQAQDRAGGLSDGFVLMTDLVFAPKWSTYWGGYNFDVFYGARFNVDSTLVVAGYSDSPDFPLKRSIQLPHKDTVADIVLAKFNFVGENLWSTVIGGKDEDYCVNICTDVLGNTYLGGNTQSVDFPTRSAIFPTKNAMADGLVVKVCPTTPMISLSPNDTVICQGSIVTLRADASLSRYVWSTGATSPTIDVQTSGTYFYSADSPLGCNAFSDTIHISVLQSIPTVIQVRGRTTLCPGDSVVIISRDAFDAYSWRDATGKEIGTRETLIVRTPGSYYLKVVDKSGCHDSSATVKVAANVRPSLKYSAVIDGATNIDSCGKSIQLCEGQQIRFQAAKGFSPLVYWSDGTTGQNLTVTSSRIVWAFVTDSIGCLWSMDTLDIQFLAKTKMSITSLDSTCVGTFVELKAQPQISGLKYRWSVDGGDILSQADSSAIVVSWSTVGQKTIRVAASSSAQCLDTGDFSIKVQSQLVGGIVPASSLHLCPGASVQLNAPPGYTHYYWNKTLGSSTFTTSTPGMVTLEFDNGSGCTGYDTVTVVKGLDYSISASVLQFDTLRIDSLRQLRLRLVNTGADTIVLTDLLRLGIHFNIDSTIPPILQDVKPGESVYIYVTFAPQVPGEHFDTLTVRFRQPCLDSIRIPISGVGKGIPPASVIRFHLADLILDPLQKSTSFAVQAWIDQNQSGLSLDSLIFTLDLNPSMLRIQSVTNGSVVSSYDLIRDRILARVALAIDTLTFEPAQVTTVTASVLLGDVTRDSIFVSSAEIRPLTVSSMVLSGADVSYTGLCTAGGTRLIGQGTPLRMMVFPTPSRGDLTIRFQSSENGIHRIFVYDADGALRFTEHRISTLGSIQSVDLPCNSLGEGVYSIVLQSPSQVIHERAIIVR